MHEFGIGRVANVAIASLSGFTIPGDVSGSDKYYAEDIVEPPILAHRGVIPVPDGPGLGVEPVESESSANRARALAHRVKEARWPIDSRQTRSWHAKRNADWLSGLVRLESPSRDKPALDTLGSLLASRLRELGASVEIIANAQGGDHVLGRFAGNPESRRPWSWVTSIRSGRCGRSIGCHSGSTMVGRSGPAFLI